MATQKQGSCWTERCHRNWVWQLGQRSLWPPITVGPVLELRLYRTGLLLLRTMMAVS